MCQQIPKSEVRTEDGTYHPAMTSRIAPSLLVAVCLLVLAAGGVGYAAGLVTSADIADETIQSTDIKNGTIANADIKEGTIGRTKLDRGCKPTEGYAFGGCIRLVASGSSRYHKAVEQCSERGGRLPTTAELKWIAKQADYTWADGNPYQYEFTGDYTSGAVHTPIAFDKFGNPIDNASGQIFWYHCITQ